MRSIKAVVCSVCLCLAWACGDDGEADADRLGVGAECDSNDDCLRQGDGGINLACLQQFKGGYCGLEDCTSNRDCPARSSCVAHTDGNYCFRSCADKAECNANRTSDNEANCSSNVDYVEEETAGKSCVPPSG